MIALTDTSGTFAEYYEYDVYGAPTIRDLNGTILDTSQFGNPHMFTGRRFDDETGLYYYRAVTIRQKSVDSSKPIRLATKARTV